MGVVAAPAVWSPIQETAAEFRHECVALEQFVDKLLHDLDYLRLEIEHKADELELAQQQLAERSRQLDEQRALSEKLSTHLERQETQLDVALGELRELRQQLDVYKQQAGERSASGEPAAEVRPTWLSEIDQLRTQLGEAQSELTSALQRAAESADAEAAAQGSAGREGSAEWLQERTELESELELVRGRAAELQDTVDQQRRELADARNEMQNELRQLRRLIEQQAEVLARSGSSGNSAVGPTVTVAGAIEAEIEASDAAGDDPVMNSVAAQFAKLQKDMAQRRKKK